VRKAFLVTERSAGIAIVIIALLSACSSQPSQEVEQDLSARARSRGADLAREAQEKARLASKAKAKDEALLFVGLAQSACKELARKTEALTLDSTVDSSELKSFIPPEIYPTDSFAAYVDEATLADVNSHLSRLVSSLVALLRSIERTKRPAIPGIERHPDDVIRERAAFQEGKVKTVVSTTMYCESVRRAGAGVDPGR
jgi:hypothetical protein